MDFTIEPMTVEQVDALIDETLLKDPIQDHLRIYKATAHVVGTIRDYMVYFDEEGIHVAEEFDFGLIDAYAYLGKVVQTVLQGIIGDIFNIQVEDRDEVPTIVITYKEED